ETGDFQDGMKRIINTAKSAEEKATKAFNGIVKSITAMTVKTAQQARKFGDAVYEMGDRAWQRLGDIDDIGDRMAKIGALIAGPIILGAKLFTDQMDTIKEKMQQLNERRKELMATPVTSQNQAAVRRELMYINQQI